MCHLQPLVPLQQGPHLQCDQLRLQVSLQTAVLQGSVCLAGIPGLLYLALQLTRPCPCLFPLWSAIQVRLGWCVCVSECLQAGTLQLCTCLCYGPGSLQVLLALLKL